MKEGEVFALGMYHGVTGKHVQSEDYGLSYYLQSDLKLRAAYEEGYRVGVNFG